MRNILNASPQNCSEDKTETAKNRKRKVIHYMKQTVNKNNHNVLKSQWSTCPQITSKTNW